MEARHMGNPETYLEVKRSKVKLTRPINDVTDIINVGRGIRIFLKLACYNYYDYYMAGCLLGLQLVVEVLHHLWWLGSLYVPLQHLLLHDQGSSISDYFFAPFYVHLHTSSSFVSVK